MSTGLTCEDVKTILNSFTQSEGCPASQPRKGGLTSWSHFYLDLLSITFSTKYLHCTCLEPLMRQI